MKGLTARGFAALMIFVAGCGQRDAAVEKVPKSADKAVVSNAVTALSADDFNKAYLLNLDVTGETSYTFRITSIDVASDKVTIGVTLTRTGKIAQKTNGVLKFYGAATVEAFASATQVPATIPNADFSNGDTATAEIPRGGDNPPTLFKAKIEEVE